MPNEKASLAVTTADWLKGQPFNNVLLFLILGSGIYGGYLGLTEVVPKHLAQIQAGYEKIDDRNREDNVARDKRHQETISALTNSFEKTLDRVSANDRKASISASIDK